MIESVAKTKWCPFMRTGPYADRGPHTAIPVKGLCIGSACMAWRASYGTEQQPKSGEFSDDGRCGLAGK